MAAPTITAIDPTDGETNVYINKKIAVTFSEALDESTVDQNTVYLTHAATTTRVSATLSFNDASTILTIAPNDVLHKNEQYRLTLVGADLSLGYSIQSSSTSDDLATTATYTFTTGDDTQVHSAEKTDTESDREGDLRIPADLRVVAGERLEILKTSPIHRTTSVAPGQDQISITFTASLDTGEFDSSWLQVHTYPLLSMDEYLAKDDGSGDLVFQKDEPTDTSGNAIDFTFPTGTWALTGSQAIWTMDTGTSFAYNTEVEVVVSPYTKDIYGNELMDWHRFIFIIDAHPLFADLRSIRRELPFLPEGIDKITDLVYAMAWRNSIDAWELTRGNIPTWTTRYLRQYTVAATALDILDDAEIPKSILAGQSKVLGDFSINWGSVVGKEGLKYKRLKEKLEDAKEALRGARGGAKYAIKGLRRDVSYKRRAWRDPVPYNLSPIPGIPITENVPAANIASSRQNKLPGQYDGWS